jgi:thioester reductase-like protein
MNIDQLSPQEKRALLEKLLRRRIQSGQPDLQAEAHLDSAERVKRLHYLSSYAIFDSIHNAGRIFSEGDESIQSEGLANGYSESKWVAEKMVRNCRSAGIPTSIYRVGWVVGHSQTGAWNRSDFIPRTIKAFLEVGKYCNLGTMTVTPVDSSRSRSSIFQDGKGL